MTDIEGNNYRTVQMGNQNWMAENLRVTHYQNGDPIPNITNGNQWTNLNSGAWVYHRNDSTTSHCPEGKLYNHFAVRDSRNICPQGWHVPDELELRELLQFADPNATFPLIPIPGVWGNSFSNWRSLASVGTNQNPSFESSVISLTSNDTIWTAVTQMTNTSGLSFVSSGYYYRGPYDEQHTFRTNRYAAHFWTSNNTWFIGYGSAGICYTREGFNPSQFSRGFNRKTDGMACRCVQD